MYKEKDNLCLRCKKILVYSYEQQIFFCLNCGYWEWDIRETYL